MSDGPRREVRLPLQVGTTAYWALERAAAILLPTFALLLVASVPLLWAMVNLSDVLPDFIGKYVFFALLIPVIIVFYWVRGGVRSLIVAVRERPSDLVVDGDSLRVEGGPHHGLRVALRDAKCEAHESVLERALSLRGDDSLHLTELLLGGNNVACAALPSERASLEALAKTINALAAGHPPPARTRPVEVVGCPACGAPVAPADAEKVACKHCGAQVAISDEIRERARAFAALRAEGPRNERRLRSLLRQPSARVANIALVALGVPMMLVWPAAAVAAAMLHHFGALHLKGSFALAVGALSAIVSGFFLLRVWIVDRQALSLAALRFGAQPPPTPDGDPSCRVCGGPLPRAPGQIFARCEYCGAENVLGLDVRGDAAREMSDAGSLTSAMARRAKDRLAFGLAALAAIGCLAGDRLLLRPVLRPIGSWTACRRGDADACFAFGKTLQAAGQNEPALALLDRGCASGHAASCAAAATLANSIAIIPDHDTLAALGRGCERGVSGACRDAGMAAWEGQLDHQPDRARELLGKACSLGNGEACRALGEILEHRRDTSTERITDGDNPLPARSRDAYGWFEKACAAGDGAGCLDQAAYLRFATADFPVDEARAHDLAARACKLGAQLGCDQVACDGGDGQRCLSLATAFARGDGIGQDDLVALALDERACQMGVARGCSEVGYLVENGRGTAADPARAIASYRRGCDSRDGEGCYDLAVDLAHGTGIAQDDAEADRLYQRACDLAYADACANLGFMIERGRGASADIAKAAALYRRACDGKSGLGCNNLAFATQNGRGVPKDEDRAQALYKQACSLGWKKACP